MPSQVIVAFNESVDKLRRQRDAAARLARHAQHNANRAAARRASASSPGHRSAGDGGDGEGGERERERERDRVGVEVVREVAPRDDPRYARFFRMISLGLPADAVALKVTTSRRSAVPVD
jgi:hypothetical protein